MKYRTLVLVVIMAAAVWAATPDKADYPIQYEVTYTGSVDSGSNSCTMNLRDHGCEIRARPMSFFGPWHDFAWSSGEERNFGC